MHLLNSRDSWQPTLLTGWHHTGWIRQSYYGGRTSEHYKNFGSSVCYQAYTLHWNKHMRRKTNILKIHPIKSLWMTCSTDQNVLFLFLNFKTKTNFAPLLGPFCALRGLQIFSAFSNLMSTHKGRFWNSVKLIWRCLTHFPRVHTQMELFKQCHKSKCWSWSTCRKGSTERSLFFEKN